MAITKVTRTLLSTGIDDQSNATAITIDSSENVGINNTVASTIDAVNASGNLVVGSGSGSEGISVYSGNTNLGSLCFADGTSGTSTYTGYITYNHSSNHMEFGADGGTEKMRILSGGGITFNGDTAAANALDDYEEGTFTPTFGGASLSTATGSYTKIGNQVTVHLHVVTTGGLPSSGGQVQIGNLPFASGSSFVGAGSIYVGPSNVSSATGGGGQISIIMFPSESYVRFVNVDTGTLGYTLWGELEVSANNVVTAIGTATYTV